VTADFAESVTVISRDRDRDFALSVTDLVTIPQPLIRLPLTGHDHVKSPVTFREIRKERFSMRPRA